jgi:signal transduction histidine kinase
LIVLLVALGYPPLQKLIEQITNKFLYKKSYDPDKLLSEVTKLTSSILNLDQLVESISQKLTNSFNAEKIGIALIEDSGKLNITYQEGFTKEEATMLTSYNSINSIVKQRFAGESSIAIIDELKMQFENGEYQPTDEKLLYLLYEHDIALGIPLKEQNELFGVLVLGTKKSGDPYTSRDLNVLNIIAGHVTIAIKNAMLYEEQKQFAATLKHEVDGATKDLQIANKRLKQLDQSKSEFLSIAAHQLRTPLTGIKGYVSMFLEGDFGELTPEQKKQLESIFRSSDRLTRLVGVFLNVSRIETGRLDIDKSKTQIEKILDEVVMDLKGPAKEKNIEITVQKPDEHLPEIFADRDKMHDVMMNLVDNAIKYTPKGWVNVRLSRSKSLISFEVRDNGIGIDPNEIDKLFQKFSRAEAVSRVHTDGSGLGLFVARKIVEAHGGRIWAESEGEGKGSSFTFTLPITENEE